MKNKFLVIENLIAKVGDFSLENINISCKHGEYHILLGPTGSGKTTLLKCILGFLPLTSGRILLEKNDISNYPPEIRRIGYVPQNYALFPHLNSIENVMFGVKPYRKTKKNRLPDYLKRIIEILNIEHLKNRRVSSLSGGEKQKVALGRALAIQPNILLLDEPFAAIDEGAKRSLWFELDKIVKEIGITVFHITHNLEEAYTLGKKLSVLINGKLIQSGDASEIFQNPKNESIARFLNFKNIFKGITSVHQNGTSIVNKNFQIVVNKKLIPNIQQTYCIRQQDIKIIKDNKPIKGSLKENIFHGTIVSLLPLPDSCLIHFKIDGSNNTFDFEIKFPAYLRQRYNLFVGKKICVGVLQPNIILF